MKTLNNHSFRRLISLCALITPIVFLFGCAGEPDLPSLNMPFNVAETHQPQAIQPGPNVIFLTAGDNIEFDAQAALISAKPGTTLVFPAGTHKFSGELISNTSHITIAGQGMDKTFLDFSEQESGAEGILSLGDHFKIQDLSVLDSAGDGIRAEGADGVTFRRVRVEWTNGGKTSNGAYGLYPILSENVIIEDCIVKGASDAGIYVGQSINIIVRRNVVENNVAGIEIENSIDADVYENYTAHNTAGILVFDLPNLVRQGGQNTRVFDNILFSNSTPNFAPKGNIIDIVPSGTGILIMANDHVEVFNNQIRNHGTASITVVSYLITDNPIEDENYDPIPESIYIHHNLLERPAGLYLDGSEMNTLVNFLYRLFSPAEIIYDGIGESFAGGTELPLEDKLCIQSNTTHLSKPARFGNLNLQNPGIEFLGIPGGPVSEDLSPHDCSHEALDPIIIPPTPPVPPAGDEYTDAEVIALCSANVSGVNWDAFVVDCPSIESYGLWSDPENPLSTENGTGIPYDLTTPLFSDYASKHRQLYIPVGESASYSEGDFDYPVGTIIAKTFYYPNNSTFPVTNQLMETRLLIHRQSGWQRLAYIWDEAQANLALGGGSQDVTWMDENGTEKSTNYIIPNANQCSTCHGPSNTDKPLGPIARMLNKTYDYSTGTANQLSHWAQLGLLTGAPADPTTAPHLTIWDDATDGSLEDRARAYLEANCAHCHSKEGRAASTGLWLTASNTLDINAGLCKSPIAAGPATGDNEYDIVPGDADSSIMVYRMESVAPEIKMPELSKTLVHSEGIELVREWINSLPGDCEI